MGRAARPSWIAVEPRSQGEVLRGITPKARHIYLELLCVCERLLPWVVSCGPAALAEQLGMVVDEVSQALAELAREGLIIRDESRRYIYLPHLLGQAASSPPNPNAAAFLGREMVRLPKCALLQRVDADFRALLAEQGKEGLLAAYCGGTGERPTLREVPEPKQTELPFPAEARPAPRLELVMSEPPIKASKPKAETESTRHKKPAADVVGLPQAWRELTARHSKLAPMRPSGLTETGLPQREERLLIAGWKEAASAGYLFADLDMVGEWVAAGGLAWHGRPAWEWVAGNVYKSLLSAESWVKEGRPPIGKADRFRSPQPVADRDGLLERLTAGGSR